MAAFATADDLGNRWKEFDGAEANRANTLLADASLLLRQWFPDLDARIESGSLDVGIPLMVVCAMVKRAMIASGREGVTYSQESENYGSFGHQSGLTFKNPEGNLYLTTAERGLLDSRASDAVSMECGGM